MNMSEGELKLFHRYLHNAKNYLEFGSGSSTTYAVGIDSLKSIISVESSIEYVKQELIPQKEITAALQSGKLQFHLVNIGETVQWGYPKDDSKRYLWPNYSISVFNTVTDIDFVLIDGRFRVACTLASILSLSPHTKIAIHDFWNRPEYHLVLKYLNVEDEAETLGVFTIKNDVDKAEVMLLLQQYQYLPER